MKIKGYKTRIAAAVCALLLGGVSALGCGGKGEVTYAVLYDANSLQYTVIGEERAEQGKDYTFTIQPKQGYAPAENFTVYVNGEAVRMDGMSYTVRNVSGELTISAKNFVVQKYTVNFRAGETVLQSVKLEYGKTPVFDMSKALPFPKDYPDEYVGAFTGWSATPDGERTAFAKVDGDTDYYAKILKMPRYAPIEELLHVYHTGATQEDTLSKEATMNPYVDAHHPYDGKVWMLIGSYEGQVCLQYTMAWEAMDYETLLADGKALTFTFSANYFDYVLTIEDKKITMDKTIYVVEIFDGDLYLNGEKLLQLSTEVYTGEREMLWSVQRSTVHTYAQFGFSDVGLVTK